MLFKRDKGLRAQPVKKVLPEPPGPHPVTLHESFAHGVLYKGAADYRAATAALLHERSHGDPTKKPHEHANLSPHWHLGRAAKFLKKDV